jgi:DNA ligase-1
VSGATLLQFAQVNDAVAAVSSKLAKQALLADYFKSLGPDDLGLAVRYAAGRPFASTDERVLAVGGAIVWDVIVELTGIDPQEFRTHTIASGEIGEALSRFWVELSDGDARAPVVLQDLSRAFDALASTGAQDAKRAILKDLFARCRTGREATYLAKIIFRDMRTGVQEGVLQAAVAQAFGKTLAEIHRCQLLIGDLDAAALLARADQLCCASFCLFHPIQFMLATPQETAADAERTMAGRAFFCEDKLDGIRAQVHKQGDRVAIYTRTMDRADDAFPDVVEAMRGVPGDFLIDGEIVSWSKDAVAPFAHLQRRLGRKAPSAGILRDYPVALVAFDLLYLDGELLMDAPLRQRRAQLEKLAARTPAGLRLNVSGVKEVRTADEITAAFDAAKARRNEGLVLKDPESTYLPGRRGKNWLKIKTHLPTLDCVVTAAEHGHGKRRGVLSDYTFAVWDRDPADGGAKLVNIGKAYSGVTDAEIAQLTELFKSIAHQADGRVYWVRPQVVLEIAFDQIQRSARHESGFALRFPRIKRIRWDKRPEDADRLARVAEIHASEANTSRDAAPRAEKRSGTVKSSKTSKLRRAPEPSLFDHLDAPG